MTQSHCQDPERTRKHGPESTTQNARPRKTAVGVHDREASCRADGVASGKTLVSSSDSPGSQGLGAVSPVRRQIVISAQQKHAAAQSYSQGFGNHVQYRAQRKHRSQEFSGSWNPLRHVVPNSEDGGERSRPGGELQSRRRGVQEFKRVKSPDPEISDRFQTAQFQTAQLWSQGSDSSVVVAGLVGSAQFACQDADDPMAIRFLLNCI